MLKRLVAVLFAVCLMVFACACGGKSEETSAAVMDTPEEVVDHYINAILNADLENVSKYSVVQASGSELHGLMVESIEKYCNIDDSIRPELKSVFGTDDLSKVVDIALGKFKERYESSILESEVIVVNYYADDECLEIVDSFNEEIERMIGQYSDTNRVLSKLLVDPSNVQSACRVNVNGMIMTEIGSSDDYLILVKISDSWKVMEYSMIGVLVDCIDDCLL